MRHFHLIALTIVAAGLAFPPNAEADIANCTPTSYSPEQITAAIQNSPDANAAIKQNACGFGGISRGESRGNLCSANSGNTGVLQLNNAAIRSLGLTPEQYANESLQAQIDQWAQTVGNSNTGAGYTTIQNDIASGATIGGATPTTGMLAACFQFGPSICKNDIAFMQANGGRCPTPSNGGRNINQVGGDTANLDGYNQSICSWGQANQASIDKNTANCAQTASCPIGPGDFPAGSRTAANATQPTASTADVTLPASAG